MATKTSSLPQTRFTLRDGQADRPTLVFLHGVYHGSWAFEEFSRAFGDAGYRVALLDMPGHWGDERLDTRSDIGYSSIVDATSQMMDEIPGRKIIIGHSLGGLVAMSLQPRTDVHAMVLMATPLPHAIRSKQWRLLVEYPRQAAGFLITGNPDWLYHHEPFTNKYLFSSFTPVEKKMYANERIQSLHEPRKLFKEIMAKNFPRQTPLKPTLIMIGSEDPTVTPEVGKQLQEITGGQIAIVDRAGHDIMLEDCARSASELILKWLLENDSADR